MAKGSSVRTGDLLTHGRLSQKEDLLPYEPNASRGDLHSCEHRRKIQEARGSDKIRFLNFAQGSLEECRYYLILIQDLRYSSRAETDAMLEEVSKLLDAYSSAIEANR